MKKYLITSIPSAGKSTFTRDAVNKLKKIPGAKVINKDIDYDTNWKIPNSDEFGAYLLQTPHGSEMMKEDGINPKKFDRIFYINPSFGEYAHRLTKRCINWLKEGSNHTFNNKFGYSFKIPPFFNIWFDFYDSWRWIKNRKKFIKEDLDYFEDLGVPLTVVEDNDNKAIDDIIKEVKKWN